jgi:hypothetical protein
MECPMTKDQVKAVLERVPTWPEDRQQELAEVALEIEAELAGAKYELAAIDEGTRRESRQRRGSKGGPLCDRRIREAGGPLRDRHLT